MWVPEGIERLGAGLRHASEASPWPAANVSEKVQRCRSRHAACTARSDVESDASHQSAADGHNACVITQGFGCPAVTRAQSPGARS